MTANEKQQIETLAKTLIVLLGNCDDSEFVENIIACILDGDSSLAKPSWI